MENSNEHSLEDIETGKQGPVNNGAFVRNTRKKTVDDPFHLICWGLGAACDTHESWLTLPSVSTFSGTYQKQHGTFVSPYPTTELDNDLVLDDEMRRKLMIRTQVQQPNGEGFVTMASPPERWDSNTSSLEAVDQQQYVFHLVRFRNENAKILDSERKVYSLFLQYQDKIKSEHEVFQKVARETAEKYKIMYESLHSDIGQYVSEAWKHRLERVKEYHPYYTKQDLIPLYLQDEGTEIKTICRGILREFGCLAGPLFPVMNADIEDRKLTRNYADLIGYLAPNNMEHLEKVFASVYKTSVSKDVNAQDLALTHDPEIVLSMSVLKTLGDNCDPNWERQWMIPIKVVKHRVKRGDQMVEIRVVYLDKPLAKIAMTAVQKNKWFYKFSAKRKLFPGMAKRRVEDYVIPLPPGALRSAPKDHKRYSAWEIEGPKGPVKMLLRSSLDGKGLDKGNLTEYIISAKPEYQPWAGAEVMSPSEINREWIAAHFRPGAVTYRARPDVYTGELLMYEKLEEHRIVTQARRLKVFPVAATPQPLVGIYSVLSSLKGLKEGEYVLHHEAKMGPFVKLSVSKTEKTPDAIDIHEMYSSVTPTATLRLSTTPWLPIDTETVTFAQKTLGRIPGTFEPQRGSWKNSRFMDVVKSDQMYKKRKSQKVKKAKNSKVKRSA